jgi:hypothetical protein
MHWFALFSRQSIFSLKRFLYVYPWPFLWGYEGEQEREFRRKEVGAYK